MLQAVRSHFEEDPTSSLETVRLVLIDLQAQSAFLEALENIVIRTRREMDNSMQAPGGKWG